MDGEFNVKVLNDRGVEMNHINVNDLLQLDRDSKPIQGVQYPSITCCFLPNNKLFICTYHRKKQTQYHFTYDLAANQQEGAAETLFYEKATQRNFPIKSFYSDLKK